MATKLKRNPSRGVLGVSAGTPFLIIFAVLNAKTHFIPKQDDGTRLMLQPTKEYLKGCDHRLGELFQIRTLPNDLLP
jgi:hypothetical protein